MDLNKLDEPFASEDIEWRVQQSGETKDGKPWCMVLAYVTNRAIMKRLDEVCGKENWKNEYTPAPDGGVMCGISINVGGQWITKWDAAENTQIEAVKGGMSGAMKRSAVQWGIGRYLYNLDESFAKCLTERQRGKEWNQAKTKSGKQFYWQTPELPEWALPKNKSENNTIKTNKKEMTPEEMIEWMKAKISSYESEEKINEILDRFKSTCSDLDLISIATSLCESRISELELMK